MVGSGRCGQKVVCIARPGGWDGVDSRYWISYIKQKVKEVVRTKSIENPVNSGILSRQQCRKERSPGMVT